MATIKDLQTGLTIFAAHLGPDASIGGADHDVIWGVLGRELPEEKLNQAEKEALSEAGWHLSDDAGGEHGWQIFV